MSVKRKRVELTLKNKLEIIAECDGPPKQSFASVAAKFNIDRSTVSKIYKKKEILTVVASSSNISRKRQRSSKVEDVDEALHRWFVDAIETDLPISGEILRKKAKKLAGELGFQDFLPSNGWLDRWKKRYGVAYKRAQGGKIDAEVLAAHQWLSTTLSDILQRYEPENIYSVHEIGLYWRALPNGSNTFSGQLPLNEITKDRITVLVCAGMTGEKRPLLVVGKSKPPPCFDLPAHYGRNGNAQMTSAIFENWLHNWHKELASRKRKIALIVDNCAEYTRLEFRFIELVFLPPNLTTLIQPCDQGVIRALKGHYRRLFILRLLAIIESSDQNISELQIIRHIDFSCSMRLLKESWDLVTSDVIVNCFRIAKFYEINTNSSSLDKDTFIFNKDDIDFDFDFDFESFVDVDENLEFIKALKENPTSQDNTEDKTDSEVPVETNEDESDLEIPETVITKAMALECLKNLQTFLSKKGIRDWRHFNQLEAQVQQIILKTKNKKALKSVCASTATHLSAVQAHYCLIAIIECETLPHHQTPSAPFDILILLIMRSCNDLSKMHIKNCSVFNN